MTTRRDFIKTTTAVAAGSMILPLSSCSIPKSAPYGLILYTVRDDMNKDPEGTLESIAKMGYEVVEAASYSNGRFYGMAPAKFKAAVESSGMKLISSHNAVNHENLEKTASDAAEAGLEYVIKPSMDTSSLDAFKKGAEAYNKFGEIFRKNDIRFGFHNHAGEFKKIDGIIPYDILLDGTDPGLVCMQLDLYWIKKAGIDPWDYFKKAPGRFELWHVKDMMAEGEQYETEIGNGILDFERIFSLQKQAGMKYYFVEQDTCRDYPPLESAKISLEYIRKMGF